MYCITVTTAMDKVSGSPKICLNSASYFSIEIAPDLTLGSISVPATVASLAI